MEGLSGQEVRGRESAVARPHLMCALLSLASIASSGQASSCFARPVIHKSGGTVRNPESTKSKSLGYGYGTKNLYFWQVTQVLLGHSDTALAQRPVS